MNNRISKKLVIFVLVCSMFIIALLTGPAAVSAMEDPYLAISKSANPAAGTTVRPGDLIEYTLKYANNGTRTETSIQIWDPLPANTSFISASNGGALSGGFVKWMSLGDLEGGKIDFVKFTVKVNPGTPEGTIISNKAGIFGDGTPRFHADPITHTVQGVIELSIEKSADPVSGSTVQEASTITYTLTYKNSGNKTATNVVITDSLPANTSFLEASNSGTFNNNVITWNLGDIAAGGSSSVTFKVNVNTGLANSTVIANQGTIDSNETDPLNSNIVTHNVSKTTVTTEGSPSTPVATTTNTTAESNTKKTATGIASKSSTNSQNTDPGSTFPRTDFEFSPWPFFIYLAVMAASLLFLLLKRRASLQ